MDKKLLLARELVLATDLNDENNMVDQARILSMRVAVKKDVAHSYSALVKLAEKDDIKPQEQILIACELGRAKLACGQIGGGASHMRSVYGRAHEISKNGDKLVTIYPTYCQALIALAQKKYTMAKALASSVVNSLDTLDKGDAIDGDSILVGALLCGARAAAGESLSRAAYANLKRLLELLPRLLAETGLTNEFKDSDVRCEILRLACLAANEVADWQEAVEYGENWVRLKERKAPDDLIEPLCALSSAYEHVDRRKGAECLDRALTLVARAVEEEPFDHGPEAHKQALKMPLKEYQLLNRLADAYLMQGRLVDSLRLYPAFMRARYTNYVSTAINLGEEVAKGIGKIKKYYATRTAAEEIEPE